MSKSDEPVTGSVSSASPAGQLLRRATALRVSLGQRTPIRAGLTYEVITVDIGEVLALARLLEDTLVLLADHTEQREEQQ